MWRSLAYDEGPSDHHFALSDALVRVGRVPTFWTHSTDQPTLILGAAQGEEHFEAARETQRDLRIVHRQAGGTAVFAAPGVLGVDVALPIEHPLALPDVVEAYRWFGEVWARALRLLSVEVNVLSVAGARAAKCADSTLETILRIACFGSLSPYEVVADGRKLVGLAQVRRRHMVLWQSGIHLHFDADTLGHLLSGESSNVVAAALRGRAVGLDELISPPPTLQTVIAAFERALVLSHHIELEPAQWTQEELEYVRSL